MIFATIYNGRRDGELWLIKKDRKYGIPVENFPTLQYVLDNWNESFSFLSDLNDKLNRGEAKNLRPLASQRFLSPLPRAYGWMDGSAYLNHVRLVRKARGADMPESFLTDPLMYQGGSDRFLGPNEDIVMASEEFGIDFEAEVTVVVDDVPMGVSPQAAGAYIRLVMICNDVSLRNLIPDELAKGFGFLISKPSSSFAPFALTPDELGDSWRDGKLHLPLESSLNGKWFGNPDAGQEMQFSFSELIAHAAKTRHLQAGCVIGSGTVSNEDRSKGSSCIAEVRTIEKIETGKSTTPFMKFGDKVKIEMRKDGVNLFGSIEQQVVRLK